MSANRCAKTIRPSISSKHEALGAEVEVEAELEEGAEKGDEETVEEIDDGEMRSPKIARTPQTPTKAEVAAHLASGHVDYRSWCPHCVHGRGMAHQHRTRPDEESEEVVVSIDYNFVTQEEEEEDQDIWPVLVGYDHHNKGLWAMAVDNKGATPSAVK